MYRNPVSNMTIRFAESSVNVHQSGVIDPKKLAIFRAQAAVGFLDGKKPRVWHKLACLKAEGHFVPLRFVPLLDLRLG